MHGVTVVAEKDESLSERCSMVFCVALPQELRHG
jgi:hypothetical protein